MKFQGWSAKPQHWYDLDFDWVGENVITRYFDFYRKQFQRCDETQYTNAFKMFEVTIRNSKWVENKVSK